MSRADLNAIQTKLKTAIQSHQLLVLKIKSDPQDVTLKKQLHDLQKEITGLSEKQKVIVQTLRRELVSRQENTDPAPRTEQPPTQQPTQVSSPLQPTDLSVKSQSNIPTATGIPTVPAIVSKAPSPKSELRSTSPPIKVPKYPGNKILHSRTQIGSSNVSYKRTLSDTDLRDIKKAVGEKKNSDEKMKLTFMASLDLVTQGALKDLQSRRTERKRRSTANPQFSYNFEPERKRVTNYLANTLTPTVKRPRGRPPKYGPSPNSSRPTTPDSGGSLYRAELSNGVGSDVPEEYCAVCGQSGQLLLCDTCNKVHHLHCLDPPLTGIPTGAWSCPQCQGTRKGSTWSEKTIAVVQSFIASKAAKEEEKRKLHKRNLDLLNEMSQLENKSNQLSESISQKCQRKHDLLETSRKTQESIEQVKNFIKVMQSS
ncbi:hypothetical protein ScPMuIL_016025 [Solemya velum]